MMNLRQRSVNVDRLALLKALRENQAVHRIEYAEALVEFHARLVSDLALALKAVKKETDVESLKNFRLNVVAPVNHEGEYAEVIEMLEMSVDETINLDSESFKAYIKNEWNWSRQFSQTKALYAAGSFIQA